MVTAVTPGGTVQSCSAPVSLNVTVQSPETHAPGDGHDVLLHPQVPLLMSQGPDAHAEHAAPAVPQEPLVCDAYTTHVPPLQQPAAQELAPHPEESLDEPLSEP